MTRPDMDAVTTPADLKTLDEGKLEDLCRHLRRILVAYGHAHGGHIGSNLAMVEATVALHRVFDSPHDAIIFDVSHQCYVHKMLTGRAWAYADPARFDDVSGFTNPDESVHDRFTLGHTGTAVSLACGLAKARDMQVAAHRSAPIGNVIAVLGDGSLSSGVAFEGLNNAAAQGGNLIIVLNDNEMSIADNVGGMYGTLARLRRMGGEGEPNLLHALGLDYRYVENGNDVHALVDAFTQVRVPVGDQDPARMPQLVYDTPLDPSRLPCRNGGHPPPSRHRHDTEKLEAFHTPDVPRRPDDYNDGLGNPMYPAREGAT